MEIAGLPLHPLVVHAVVVIVPVSAAFTVWFALMPGWRWLSRWPTAVLAVGAVVLAWTARLSGNALLEARPELEPLVRTHEERGELLSLLVIPFAVLVLVAAWSLGGPSALASGRGHRDSRLGALDRVLPVVLVVAALGVVALVVLTGDSGSRAVWG